MLPKIKNLVATIFVFLFFLTTQVSAGIGVSPGEIDKRTLRPGTTVTQEVTLSQSDPKEDLVVKVQIDVPNAQSWFSFEPGSEFTIPKGEKQFKMKVKIAVPADAKIEEFKGALRFSAVPKSQLQSTSIAIVTGARLDVGLLTTNQVVKDLQVKLLEIADSNEQDQVVVKVKLLNNGNTADTPTRVTLEVQDLNQKKVESLETTDLEQVQPSETKVVEAKFSPTIDEGEYFGIARVYAGDKLLRQERLNFHVKHSAAPAQNDGNNGNRITINQETIVAAFAVIAVLALLAAVIVTVIKSKKAESAPVLPVLKQRPPLKS